ncbi:hypothetical protein E3N88_33046 [Mikania micrantha]|uniref:Uncharacterized protein n=1 Tax=Mikania micrantha TaxID=192012 RepID=A0A5N6MAT1_9ASTR|nr:hypothetical protein E3N88_33046 [Mikania micrantha]
MVRTKQPTGKGKGRAEASSSRQPSQPPAQRRRIDNSDEEEEQIGPKPIWGGDRDHFAPFGLVQYFDDLGWGAVINFEEMKVERLYLKLIEEWVGSLTIDWGNRSPSTLRLIGTIEGVQVVMSRENLSHVARSDKTMVRHPEVPVLYALMTGKPKISFRYLAMLNIWEARNNKDKKMIPHCKLIQALIRWHGLINDDDHDYMRKHHTPLRLNTLNTQAWEYKLSERYHRLKDLATLRVWDVLKLNARPLQPGEHDTFDGEAVVVEVNMATEEDEDDGMTNPSQTIQRARPIAWQEWPLHARAAFDQGIRSGELRRREAQRLYERNEQWHQLHAYNF